MSLITKVGDLIGSGIHSLWDANDVARYLKASRSWVYQKAEAGVLPCMRICGLLRFDPRAIKAFTQTTGALKSR